MHEEARDLRPNLSWGEEVASFLARFGMAVSLGVLAVAAALRLAAVRPQELPAVFLQGALWAGACWSLSSVAISLALAIRAALRRRIDRGALLTLGGASLYLGGLVALAVIGNSRS